jgi:ABC-type transport system involved in multi-copper enzyme maturation permease subunit
MFRLFFSFELRYWLKSWMLWIFLAVIALMIFGASSAPDEIIVGGALGNTHQNAPFVIENFYSFICLLTLLMTTAFVNSAASRDFAFNTDQLLFATPIRKLPYLGGRFLGSALVSVIPLLGVSIGILVAKHMPWITPERWGPVYWSAHLQGILVFALPNTLLIAAIIFAIAVLTRSTIASFVGSLILITAYSASQAFASDIKNETIAALIDPFAVRTFALATKYWTVSDKNHMVLGYTGLLLWNRVIWLAVGALIFAFAYWRFSFAQRARTGKPAKADPGELIPVVVPQPSFSYGFAAHLQQFFSSTRLEFKVLVKSVIFIVIALAAMLNCLSALIFNATEGFGDTSLPVTYNILNLITGTLYLFLYAMITYFAGTLIWEERDARVDEIYDAMPQPVWPAYLSKLVALLGSVIVLQVVAAATGMIVQLAHHFHRIQPALYLETLFGIDFTSFLFFAILAFSFHVISPNKYIGYFIYIVFAILNLFIWTPLHIATNLVQFGSRPNMTYSDFFGYSPYMRAWTAYTLYWGMFCILLAILSVMLWQRGRETAWKARFSLAGQRFRGPLPVLLTLSIVAFVLLGGWIYWNTEILNKTTSQHDAEVLQTDYEKTYKKYEHQQFPRVIDIKYAIDLQPETSNMVLHGTSIIKNETSVPMPTIHFSVADPTDFSTQIDLDGTRLVKDDRRLAYRIYNFTTPMQPGETRTLKYTVQTVRRGFQNSITDQRVVENGTFFDNSIAPQIGYQQSGELTDPNKRKKYGLGEAELMPVLETGCTVDCRDSYLSNSSDLVNVDTVISTAPGQIAIAPGSLLRTWNANGRVYFHYQLDHPEYNYYAFLSANYVVARRDWNGVKIEVYYLKEHPWNVPKMLDAVQQSLSYYSANFSPYKQHEARIIEFPRVASFAQAFPGTMPYSESIGFIANLEHPDDIDKVFFVVGHEMGHQWWAYQVLGANMEGATSLSETLAQYSTMMVMEKKYGPDKMRKFLQYNMDGYLRARGRERLKERPLERVEANQGYIHYDKGAVVMYYLREMIGEEAVNTALRRVIQQHAYQVPPYPTSLALVDALREQTPQQYQYLIKDLFEDITLFSNRALDATAHKRADGKYDVTVKVETHKFKADAQGSEHEVPVDDWIEIGALAAPVKGHSHGDVLTRERMHMSTGTSTYTFTTDTLPDKAGIDPLLLLVDRLPEDNLHNVTLEK